jgi:hypothetical protein
VLELRDVEVSYSAVETVNGIDLGVGRRGRHDDRPGSAGRLPR